MSLLRVAVVLCAVFALFWASLNAEERPAAGQLKFGATVGVGFGVVETESTDTRAVDGFGEAAFSLAGSQGPISARLEIVVAESATALDGANHEVVWSPSKSFSITISGQNFGIAPDSGNISVVNAPGGPVGDEEAFIDFSGTGMFHFAFTGGEMEIGLAVLDDCKPECGYASDSSGTLNPDSERATALVHFSNTTGALAYNAYFASSTGTFATTKATGSGKGGGVGLSFGEGGFKAGFDLSVSTLQCNPVPGNSACTNDTEETRWGVAVILGGFGTHYLLGEKETGSATIKTANIDIVYLFKVEGATIGPEFRTTTTTQSNGTETTDSFLLFGMSMEF